MDMNTEAATTGSTPSTARTTEWDIDPAHSSAHFSLRHMVVTTVRGGFDKLTGSVSIDELDFTRSKVDVTIDATSINTREAKRDEHLKSADFFDVAQFPVIGFKSTLIERADGGSLKLTGDLTMHGVVRPVTLLVEGPTSALKNPWGQTVRGVSATAKLNRKDWGLGWNQLIEAGGLLVGEEVKLQLDIELIARAAVQQ
jgi:polyisoprenoid-binding protein YceI